MNVAITGGGGFLGRRLAELLLARPEVERIRLVDSSPIAPFAGDGRIEQMQANLTAPGAAKGVVEGADAIFHLAAVVSGQAEASGLEEGTGRV